MTSLSAGHIILTPTQPVGSRAGGHSGDRAHDLLTKSRALYRLSYRAPTLSRRTLRSQFQPNSKANSVEKSDNQKLNET